MNWEMVFKVGTTGVGGFVGYMMGGWDTLLKVLLICMVIDQLTGLFASYVEGTLSSRIGFRGIAKKVTILFVVVVAAQIDQTFGANNVIRDAVMFFYIGNELLSFVENAGRMGIPLPPQLINAVAVLKGKGEGK